MCSSVGESDASWIQIGNEQSDQGEGKSGSAGWETGPEGTSALFDCPELGTGSPRSRAFVLCQDVSFSLASVLSFQRPSLHWVLMSPLPWE